MKKDWIITITIVSGFFLLAGLNIFWSGLHNADLSVNIMNNVDGWERLTDIGIDGQERPIKELYILGMTQIIISSSIMIPITSFIFAFSL